MKRHPYSLYPNDPACENPAHAIIDANSGHVYWMPHTICCWPDIDEQFRPIAYRLKSRLIIFSGIRDEKKDGDQGTHYYEFKDGKFAHIRSVAQDRH